MTSAVGRKRLGSSATGVGARRLDSSLGSDPNDLRITVRGYHPPRWHCSCCMRRWVLYSILAIVGVVASLLAIGQPAGSRARKQAGTRGRPSAVPGATANLEAAFMRYRRVSYRYALLVTP